MPTLFAFRQPQFCYSCILDLCFIDLRFLFFAGENCKYKLKFRIKTLVKLYFVMLMNYNKIKINKYTKTPLFGGYLPDN